MAPKFLPLLFVSVSVLAAALSSEAAVVGGWKPIENPKDQEVLKIGGFAVSEHNKQTKSSLVFVTVESGETQVVAGLNYRLVISAKDDRSGATSKYRAVVWARPGQKSLQLTSFEKA